MSLNFPINPIDGQTYQPVGLTQTYTYGQGKWSVSYVSATAVSASHAVSASYVDIVGNGITVNYSGSQIQLTGSGGGGSTFPYVGDAQITGSLNVSGGITGSLSGSVSNIGDEYTTPPCQTIVTLTALEYAAISPKDPNTLYFIV
jgi:hypothetical protein